MTRINLVPPSELMDQHLFAEFREIKMVPKALGRSIKSRGSFGVLKVIPKQFTLNTGHVCFFYDKGLYLAKRYEELKKELTIRGINFNKDSKFDPDGVMTDQKYWNDWVPSDQDYDIIRTRIQQKISMKPNWYRKTT